MNYSRTTLRKTATSLIQDWKKYLADADKQALAEHKKAFAKWEQERKPKLIAALTEALAKAKKGQPCGPFYSSDLPQPPSEPKLNGEHCCHATIQSLETLVVLLDTLADDAISSTALSQAGIKDLNRLLRRPC